MNLSKRPISARTRSLPSQQKCSWSPNCRPLQRQKLRYTHTHVHRHVYTYAHTYAQVPYTCTVCGCSHVMVWCSALTLAPAVNKAPQIATEVSPRHLYVMLLHTGTGAHRDGGQCLLLAVLHACGTVGPTGVAHCAHDAHPACVRTHTTGRQGCTGRSRRRPLPSCIPCSEYGVREQTQARPRTGQRRVAGERWQQ